MLSDRDQNTTGLTADQQDACSGIALLYMGPSGKTDEWANAMQEAIDNGNALQARYVCAFMLGVLDSRLSQEAIHVALQKYYEAFIADKAEAPGLTNEVEVWLE